MTLLKETIVVPRPVEDCYRYIADFSTIEQWDTGVFRSEKVTAGPVKPGTRFDVVLNLAGRESPMSYEMLEMQANERLVLRGVSSTLEALDTISFIPVTKDKTKIIYEADLNFQGPLAAAEPLMTPVLNRIGKAAVEGMKTALTPPLKAPRTALKQKLADKLILPGASQFTKYGYRSMPNKGLSEFMDGKTVAITGPTSGLGLAAACEFARLGATLILVGRNADKLKVAKQKIADFSGRKPAEFKTIKADLALVSDTRKAAVAIKTAAPQLDVLVNNAGTLFNDRQETKEGNEASLAINLLAPWTLTESLMDHIRHCQTHVINVVSGGMYLQGVKLSDMQFSQETYDGSKAYARAKRAMVHMTEYWDREHKDSGARFNSMHPGWAATPGVEEALPAFNKALDRVLRDSRMGADTIVWLAAATAATGESGRFWFDRTPRTTQVIPGTALTRRQQARLAHWLADHTAVGDTADTVGKETAPA